LVGKDTKYSVPLSMTSRKYQLRSGRQPRLQTFPQSMRKSVPGGEKSDVVVLALVVVVPVSIAVSLPEMACCGEMVMLSAGTLVVSDILRI